MRVLSLLLAAASSTCILGVRILRQQQPPRSTGSKRAIVSLFYGSSSPSLLNLRITMSSARRHGTQADRLVMVPQGDAALRFRSLLESDGVRVVEVPGVDVPAGMRGVATGHWTKILTKFMAFNLTTYDRVLLIDTDAYFSGNGSPDGMFEDCGSHELCLAEDNMPELYMQDCPEDPNLCRQLNTGVMVFTPSAERLENILEEARKDHHAYHYPDQQFFTRYLRSKDTAMSWKLLDPFWNCCGYDPPAEPDSRAWVGHLCGGWVNGHTTKFCTANQTCPTKLRAWQQEALVMDPCLRKQSYIECEASQGCGWCQTYCMDSRVACTNITFDQAPETWGLPH